MESVAPSPFIVGVGRSGTTLLRLMLDAHPAIAIPPETHFIPALESVHQKHGSIDDFVRAVIAFPSWNDLSIADRELYDGLKSLRRFDVPHGLRWIYRKYAERFGKQRWGDKTPPYRTHLSTIASLLPEARFIHLIRDGRDVALSYRGLWFGPGDGIEEQARFWVREITQARCLGAKVPHYLEIRYEDLVSNAASVLQRIAHFLDVSSAPEMMLYYDRATSRLNEFTDRLDENGRVVVERERILELHRLTATPPDIRRIGGWKTAMSNHEQKQYERIAGPLLANLGYETRSSAPWA